MIITTTNERTFLAKLAAVKKIIFKISVGVVKNSINSDQNIFSDFQAGFGSTKKRIPVTAWFRNTEAIHTIIKRFSCRHYGTGTQFVLKKRPLRYRTV